MIKLVSENLGAVAIIVSTVLVVSSIGFWWSATLGSWNNKASGCLELDLRPTLEGVLVAPDGTTFTKYSGGFSIFNWVSFNYYTERKGKLTVGGIATGWINPFTNTLIIRYKEQTNEDILVNGYRESTGLVFERSFEECK